MGANDWAAIPTLDLNVGRWGNSLAVRLPAELARKLGITEGSTLHVEPQQDNSLLVSAPRARKVMTKAEWIVSAKKHLASMPKTKSVIREMRDNARY
jgi:antitoxin MazE